MACSPRPASRSGSRGSRSIPQTLFYDADGRPRVSVFSIAHLGDAERMFFVSLLLNQMVGWMRRQSGTTSLRAILYMDEILGYFPPVANPPSKAPLLTLLKQGRAFGLGVVLATQNPVDLDYKGLANTGTWFLGRLQTERDKARVLDGLEGTARRPRSRRGRSPALGAEEAHLPDAQRARRRADGVRDALDAVVPARAALARPDQGADRATPRIVRAARRPRRRPAAPARAGARSGRGAAPRGAERPVVPPGVEEFFLPARGRRGAAALRARHSRRGARQLLRSRAGRRHHQRGPLSRPGVRRRDSGGLGPGAEARPDARRSACGSPRTTARTSRRCRRPPAQAKKYSAWQKAFARWLAQNERIELLRHPALGVAAKAGESERDFRIRLQHEGRAARDEAIEAVRRKYAPKQAALAERLRRAEQAVEREQQQASDQKVQTAVSMGATLLGALFGRKAVSVGTLGRATTAARGVGRTMKEASDVKRAAESVESVKAAVAALEGAARRGHRRPSPRGSIRTSSSSAMPLAPKRGQVEVQFVALAGPRTARSRA